MINLKYVYGDVYFRDKILNTYPYLSCDLNADICIIGGGISGLITAYYLSKGNRKVVIIEKNIIGFGSSSCDLGVLDLDISRAVKFKTEEELRKIVNLYNDAKKDFIEIAEKVGYENIEEAKRIIFTNKIMQKSNMQKYIDLQNSYGKECEFKDKDENINSNLNIEFENKVLNINIYEFLQKLAIYLVNNCNVEIYENTEAISVKDTYEEVSITTNNEFIINAKKLIYCNGIEFLNIVDLDTVEVYQRFNVATKINFELKEKKLAYSNFNFEDMNINIISDGRAIISDSGTKINIKLLDDDYRKYVEKDKFTKLILYLNKLVTIGDYLEADYCWSYLVGKTQDGMPFIDELECKDNCFCNVPLGQSTVLSSIIGGKMLKNIVKGLFTKEMKFFRLSREKCN